MNRAIVVVMAVAALASSARAQSVAEFYAGRQINMLVGSSAGGGYDTQGRLVAKHLGKYIPGNPTIVVQNMPAAGSLAATNTMFNVAAKDGTAIALVQRGMLLVKNWNPTAVRFDLGKFNWLGSINREVGMSASWYTTSHHTMQDLFDRELIVGASNGIDPETTPRLLNALLGTKFKVITGYPGVTEVILAMERGEVQGIGDWSVSSIKVARPDWLRDKKINLLLQFALQKDPDYPQVPYVFDYIKNEADRKVMELYLTQKTVARPMLAPPGVPADRIEALRTAFTALARDKDFLADAQRAKLEVDMVPGPEVDKVVALITSASPETAARLGKAIESDKK